MLQGTSITDITIANKQKGQQMQVGYTVWKYTPEKTFLKYGTKPPSAGFVT